MKSVLALLMVLNTLPGTAAPGDAYSTNIHVKNSHMTLDGGQLYQRLDAVIDGRTYELAGAPLRTSIFSLALLLPGDYKARVVKDERKVSYKLLLVYEVMFPDGKTDRFTVIGMSE